MDKLVVFHGMDKLVVFRANQASMCLDPHLK